MFIVFHRFKTEQGKAEAVLTARFSVASARVTARLRKDGDDLIGEIDRLDLRKLLDHHCQRGAGIVLARGRDGRGAITQRRDPTGAVDSNHVRR